MKRIILRSRQIISRAAPGIIFTNILVFIWWQFSAADENSFMAQNFLVSWDSITQGRPWTVFTSVYSHNAFFHLFINMFVLLSFAPLVEVVLGYRRFLTFYWLAGIFSSVCHAVVSNFIMHQPELQALGASGAIAGVILLFALLYPKQKILLLGIIPLPAIWGAIVAVGLDLWGLIEQVKGHGLPIGHGAHLGGALAGVLYYYFYLRPRLRPKSEFQVIRSDFEPG